MKSNEQRREGFPDYACASCGKMPVHHHIEDLQEIIRLRKELKAARADMLKHPPEEWVRLTDLAPYVRKSREALIRTKAFLNGGGDSIPSLLHEINVALSALKAFDAAVAGNVNVESRKK